MNRQSIRIHVLTFMLLLLSKAPLDAYVLSYSAHVTVTEEYNDNLYRDPDNEVDDFITVISPGVNTDLRWQRAGVDAFYDLGYSMYQTYSENDSLRHRASVGGWWDVTSRTQIQVRDTYIQSEDTTDLGSQGNGEFQRESYESNTARMDLTHRFGERRNASLGYAYSTLKNDVDETDNNQSHELTGALSYFFTPWIGMESQVGYTRGLYDVGQDFDQLTGTLRFIKVVSRRLEWNISYTHFIMTWNGQGPERDYQVYNPSVGVRYTMDNESYIDVNAGYFVQDLEDGDNEKGFTMNGTIGKTWSFRRGSLGITASSGYEESQLGTDNLGFTVFYGVESEFEYNIKRDVTTTVNARYRNNDYRNEVPERKDDDMRAAWALNWQIKQWLESRFEYSWAYRNSNIDENDFTENRVLLSLTWLFSGRTSSSTP